MSLMYRAIWNDDRPGLIEQATGTFVSWARGKHGTELEFEPAPTTVGAATTSLREVANGGVSAAEAVLVEETGADRWMTRQRVLVAEDGQQWVWVDLERTTSQVFRQQDVDAPRLVRQLLEDGVAAGGRPRVGPVLLRSKAVAIRPEDVATQIVAPIRDPERTVPILVFSHDENVQPKETMDRATTTQQILAGVVQVVVVSPTAQVELTKELGEELSVWGGAARLYLPGSLDPWRHRYYLRKIIEQHHREVGRRISRSISGAAAARRAPAPYEAVRALLRGSGHGADEMLSLAYDEIQSLEGTIDALRSDIERRDERLLERVIDIEQLNEELEAAQRMTRYWMERALGGDELIESDESVPDQVSSSTEAAEFCQRHLSLVSLPDDAIVDLVDLDAAPESTAWAKTAWRGFRALQAYAEQAAETNGGFWQWCERGAHVDGWPATTKKLSMTESDSVLNNKTQRAARTLPIDPAVEPSGRIEMLAHLKIAEGGGTDIPRIYFYDDTGGTTKKIHIGFFGPHRYMENTKT